MIPRKCLLVVLTCYSVFAQQQIGQLPPPDLAEQPEAPIERTSVNFVQAPTTVTDRDNNLVNGILPTQFHLFDNGKEQNIQVDLSAQPLSLVVVVQKSGRLESILPQIQRVGNLIGPQVIGEQGECAVIAFDHRIQMMQPFTNDGDKIEKAFKSIHAGGTNARMIDAVDKAVYLLRSRPQSRRKVVLLISETRDKSSEGKVRETLLDAQLSNVTVYTVNVSRVASSLTAKPEPPRPDPLPPSAHSLPGGNPATPTTIAQSTGLGARAEFVPLFVEIYKDAKGLFVDNPATVFTHETGGAEFSFLRQHGLEDAIQRISDEIHSQYMISYNPNNKTEGGFHEIVVKLERPDLKARTRPGYYLASLGK